MLPLLVGVVALAVMKRGAQSREPSSNQLIIELDTSLPRPEVEQVIDAIRTATPETAARLDAMASAYRQRSLPLTSYELARRAWDVRGRQGPPPAPPHPDAGMDPRGMPSATPPVGCLDAASDPKMCQAVTSALLTETNPDKLHAFAETLRGQYPRAAEALDSKAVVFGGPSGAVARNGAAPHANGAAHTNGAPHANGAPAPQPWVQVSSDMGNVPPQYHAALVSLVQQLARDDSMTPGSERAVAVGDRMFVFVKPPPSPDVQPGTVWVTRMAVGPDEQTASTGYGSGPLWPVDIIDGRNVPPDRRYMGSPTIFDPATSILSPPAPMQTVLMHEQVQPVEMVYVGGDPSMAGSGGSAAVGSGGGEMGDGGGPPMPPMHVGTGVAAAVAAMPQGAAFGGGGLPGIMGASRPDIVGSEQAALQHAAAVEQQQMQMHIAMQEQAMQQAAAEQAVVDQPNPPDRRAASRPRPSMYVVIRTTDSVWPQKIAKIGSGNKHNFDQLIAMNPHLVSPSGAWRQMFPGDEVCIPPEWVDNLRARGFLVKSDYEGS
jgi:hypothetical protein